jgi:hypothetical protein
MTLREIANGSVTFENIKTLGQPAVIEQVEEPVETTEEATS